MKVSSFKQFLEEDDSKAIVQTGINSKGLDNTVTKEIINSRLVAATNHAYLTPYIALGNIARILAYVGIVVPQYTFLDREEGEVVFDAPQFGEVAGVNIDGTPAHPKTQYFIYFSYAMNEDGYYDCFAVIVDIDELDDILDEGGEMEDEADEVHNAQKLGEDVDLSEVSEDLHPRQKIRIGKFVNISSRKRRDPIKHEIVGFKPGSDPSGNLDSYTVRGHLPDGPVYSTRDVPASQIHNLNPSMHEPVITDEVNEEVGVKEEAEVEEGFTKDWNKYKKTMYLVKKGYKTAATDPKSVKNTRAFAVRNARDMMKKEEAKIEEGPIYTQKVPPGKDPVKALIDLTRRIPGKNSSDENKKSEDPTAHSTRIGEEITSIDERKSSDPKGLAYKVTAASHAAHPEWGPADHTKDPKTHFGTAATRSSTLAAVRAIRGNRNFDANNPSHVDAAAKAVHGSPEDHGGKPKGWSQTAMTHSGQTPEQKERRAKLTGPYSGLSDDEKEKDREIVRTVASNIKKK
jgi:hypothetical protein